MGAGGQHHNPGAHRQELPGTHCIGGRVGPRVILDGCGKSSPLEDSISGPSIP